VNIGIIILTSFVAIIAIGIIAFAATFTVAEPHTSQETENEPEEKLDPVINLEESQTDKILTLDSTKYLTKEPQCKGDARCFSGFLTRVIDGDTIVVGDKSIRFALVNTPEWGDYDYVQAGKYIETICPLGSRVLVDEDDGQTEGSYGRIIGKINCNHLNLNEEILEVGHAEILTKFCSVSEFAEELWAQKFGC